MIYNFEDLRKPHTMPNYPSYSVDLLEEYFFSFFQRNIDEFLKKSRTYIPIFYTNILCENQPIHYKVQEYLNVLDQTKPYFTVSQHDLDVVYKLPTDTLLFAAGGLSGKGIPIPLIGSAIPEKYKEPRVKNILCSGIYSMTHPLREQVYGLYKNNKDFIFNPPRSWTDSIPENDFVNFCENSKQSVFGLAIRGFGLNSFRLYELMQLGTIPVIVTDKIYLPWQDELNWEEFCVIITPDQIPNLYNILNDISEEKRQQMLNKIQEIYKDYFSLDGVCLNIVKRLT